MVTQLQIFIELIMIILGTYFLIKAIRDFQDEE